MTASESLLSRAVESPRSFVQARIDRLKFATPAQARAAFYEISALIDCGRIELTIDRAGCELLIGVREKQEKRDG